MKAWLLEEELGVQTPTGRGDEDWEKEAWETDDTPDWADDEDEDWEDDDEEEDDEGYDVDEDEDDD